MSVPTVKTHVHNLLHKLGARRRADAGRLLHVAASEAAVEARPARHLGVVGRTRAEPGDRPQHMRVPAGLRMRRRLDRISTESPPSRAENAAWAVREYARGARHAVAG